jgi:arginyl-tRNA synthetase
VISSDVRRAIGRAVAAAGHAPAEPRLRPTGTPGQYASSVGFALGEPPDRVTARIAALLAKTENFARVDITGPGFITITVPPEALTNLPERMAVAGPACAASDALRGLTVPAPPPADPLAAPGWAAARTALVAQLTARLAAAAGATLAFPEHAERTGPALHGDQSAVGGEDTARSSSEGSGPRAMGQRRETDVAAAVAFAGYDAVRFSLARAVPGRPLEIDPLKIARHILDNPAYAVRYAHARAASGVRWGTQGETSWPTSSALLDALSWLPERVASAARQGSAQAPGTDRLSLARTARTGLAAGLGLLGVSAPDRV